MLEPVERTKRSNVGLRILAGSAAGLLLSLGLCGLGGSTGHANVSGFLLGAGILALGLSVFGLVIGFIVAVGVWLSRPRV